MKMVNKNGNFNLYKNQKSSIFAMWLSLIHETKIKLLTNLKQNKYASYL